MDTSEPLNKSQLAASSSKDSSIRKDIDNSGSGTFFTHVLVLRY